MSLVDFGTVQVYEMTDMVEVVFPYDKPMGKFLYSLNGSWSPKRKCWQINPSTSKRSAEEITEEIRGYLNKMAPKNWDKILEVLKGHGCVSTKLEVYAGLSGVRITIPLGHPYHHHLKSVDGLFNNRKQWLIPAPVFSNKIVQQALARVYNEDQKRFLDIVEPVEERCLIGELYMPEEDSESFGIEKGELVAADASLIAKADPAMASSDIREFAFEVLRFERKDRDKAKVSLEYVTDVSGYEFLKKRVYRADRTRPLTHANDTGEAWIQRRS